MFETVYDLKAFYNSKQGRVVRRIIKSSIRNLWPNVSSMRVLGTGYSIPYLGVFAEEAERIFSVMYASQGAHLWPKEEKNLNCLADNMELPIETASIDRVLMVHDLEFSKNAQSSLQEIWRVLKSNGRLLVIVPNRTGLWAHADWAPFGHGRPYTSMQIHQALKEYSFIHEKTEEALFMPPMRSPLIFKSAGFFEGLGRRVFPFVSGVHLVEVSKQLYAKAQPGSGAKIQSALPTDVIPIKPALNRQYK